jgi:hypothetical protein
MCVGGVGVSLVLKKWNACMDVFSFKNGCDNLVINRLSKVGDGNGYFDMFVESTK